MNTTYIYMDMHVREVRLKLTHEYFFGQPQPTVRKSLSTYQGFVGLHSLRGYSCCRDNYLEICTHLQDTLNPWEC